MIIMYSNKLRNKVISELFFILENWPKEWLWKKSNHMTVCSRRTEMKLQIQECSSTGNPHVPVRVALNVNSISNYLAV